MVEIPTAIVYVATAALIIVCGFLAVLLFYLIKLARIVNSVAEYIDGERRRIRSGALRAARTFSLLFSFIRDRS